LPRASGKNKLLCGKCADEFKRKMKRLPSRIYIVLACYGVLVLVGLYVLLPARNREEQFVLALFLAVFAILVVKTIAHFNMKK
jgi:peptidoglycan/LPS O-acetylase OafA/YrhL